MTPEQWIVSDDTGISSRAIWAVMMGAITEPTNDESRFDVPHDPSDFGRCLRLIQAFPEWRGRLHLVPQLIPFWEPVIREWDGLERLYLEEAPSGRCPKLWEVMQGKIRDEVMELKGYEKKGKGYWVKGGQP